MPFGIDQSGKYMRIYRNKHELNSYSSTNLTINAAVNMLAEPRKPESEEPEAEKKIKKACIFQKGKDNCIREHNTRQSEIKKSHAGHGLPAKATAYLFW